MKHRFIFIPGNQSIHWSFAWAPWLKSELEKHGYNVFFETFPDSIIAREEYWIPFLKDFIRAGEGDVLIGWSSGAAAAMRYAEANRICGSILVAPSYTDLGDELEAQSGYFNRPWKWQQIKKNQDVIALFCSDNDPYIPKEDFLLISSQLSAGLYELKGAEHFIERHEFPELMEYIRSVYR